MPKAKLKLNTCKFESLNHEDTRDLYALKVRHLPLGPGVSTKEDAETFWNDCRSATALVVGRCADGQIQGFCALKHVEIGQKSRRALVFYVDYWVLNEKFQRSFEFSAHIACHVIGHAARRAPRPAFIFGTAFPASYISARRVVSRVWAYGETSLSETVKGYFNGAGSALFGTNWDSTNGLVKTRCILGTPKQPRNAASVASFQKYLKYNPRYQEGLALSMMIPVDLKSATEVLGWALAFGYQRATGSLAEGNAARRKRLGKHLSARRRFGNNL